MNTDKIAIVGDAEDVESVQDAMRRIVNLAWENIQVLRRAGHPAKYSIGVGFNMPLREAIPRVQAALNDMVERKIVNDIEIVDGDTICKINLSEHLKAAAFEEVPNCELVTFGLRTDTLTADDKLEPLGKFFRDVPSPQSTRGKSNMMQSMTLLALHNAFGMNSGRPQPTRFYNGNNAATTILGNIGRKKLGGKK